MRAAARRLLFQDAVGLQKKRDDRPRANRGYAPTVNNPAHGMSAPSAQPAGGGFLDAWAIFLNVGSSVGIIMVNKQLMGSKGYAFVFATTLNAFHYLTTTLGMFAVQQVCSDSSASKSNKPPPRIPLSELILFTVIANVSILSLNFSLMINTVGVYQIAKLCIVPYTGVVEYFLMGRTITPRGIAFICVMLFGVAVISISDVNATFAGSVWAILSIFASGSQQIMVSWLQERHAIKSAQLLSQVAPAQALSLMLIGPFLDRALMNEWVYEYQFTAMSLMFFVTSCSFSVLVNYSQFLCLGRFSAVTYQVMAHLKTVLVLVIGMLLFDGTLTSRLAMGMMLALTGIIGYGYSKPSSSKSLPAQTAPSSAGAGGRDVEQGK